jgi:hypothetical protein
MRNHKKTILYILLIILIIWQLIVAIIQGGDLESYLRASKRIIENEPLYVQEVVAYIYPPLLAFILIPLTLIPPYIVKVIWFFLNIFLIYLSFKLLLNTIDQKNINIFTLSFFSIFFTLRFFMDNSNLGQINIVILFLCGLTLYFFTLRKDFLAGIFLASAIVIKVTPIFLLLYFVFKREFKLSFYTLSSLIFFLLIPSLSLGFTGNIDALIQYKDIVQNIYDSTHLNQSLYNTIIHFLSPVPLWNDMKINIANLSEYQIKKVIYTIFGIISIIFAFIFRKKIKRDDANILLEYSMVIVLMLLFSPVSRKAHFVILLIPHFFYLYFLLEFKTFRYRKLALIILITSFVLNTLTVEGFMGRDPSDFMESYSCVTFGTITLLIGLVLLHSKKFTFFEKVNTSL